MDLREPTRRSFLRGALIAGAGIAAGCETTGGGARAPRRSPSAAARSNASSNISVPSRTPKPLLAPEESGPSGASEDAVAIDSAEPAIRPPMDPDAVLRCAVIGVGGQGSRLLQDLLTREDVEVVAIADAYDVWRDRALTWCSRHNGGAAGFVDFEDMFAQDGIHAVFVATPDHLHATAARAALRYGADVYVEPPLALTWSDAADLAAAARQHGAIVCMGHPSRTNPMIRYARDILEAGAIGHLISVDVRRGYVTQSLDSFEPPREASKRNVHWKSFLGDTDPIDFDLVRFFQWPCFCEYSNANMSMLLGPQIDTCHALTGSSMPHRVAASGGVYLHHDGRTCPDTFTVLAEYPDGFHFTGTCVPVLEHESSVERYLGSEGSIEIRDQRDMTIFRENSEEHWEQPAEKSPTPLEHFLAGVRTRVAPEAGAAAGFAEAATCAMAMQSLSKKHIYVWDSARLQAIAAGADAGEYPAA